MSKCLVIKLPEMGQCCDAKEGAEGRECAITVKVQCTPAGEDCGCGCTDDKPADKPASGK